MGGGGLIWYLPVAALVICSFFVRWPRHGISDWHGFVAAIPVGLGIPQRILAFRGEFCDRKA